MQEREDRELREGIEKETNPEKRAKLEALLKHRQEERAQMEREGKGYAVTVRNESEMGTRREQEEKEMKARQAELARQAKITMDQAIQIATSQYPGKVLECSLNGEHWEAPGKLASDGLVFYHVVILSGDETNSRSVHVLVNAIDGRIIKAEKEERKNETSTGWVITRTREPISGGELNGNALSLPPPQYPAIARSARASGTVTVQVTIDEQGNVSAARAVSGHPLLQAAAASAAREAKFSPTLLDGEPVKVTGLLTYNFVAQ
jgi:TonB family protein